ncbi:MAG: D-glycero-beta-D-manno-heptose 1-phosphate adenylyltransferase [Desulfamplus sp.]|nr:D-glycero-beta-D-manno-heptose 1-phosphate adenylyltransferase [Desulfamplus sp.]MBF0257446.1 D-glycero-beta-D-manno-heptose 1-phosphate adenylyltransferase [Desulfamplus sp.]
MATMKKTENKKIVDKEEIKSLVEFHKSKGYTVVFTNGCFDILHAGHITYLAAAAEQGDVLVVGLNSDASVKKIKGDKRPVVEEAHRAKVLAALACVDYVVLFDEPDPENLIMNITPDILVKGADWTEDRIIGAGFVRQSGGKVERIDLVPQISTTTIIDRIVMRYGC